MDPQLAKELSQIDPDKLAALVEKRPWPLIAILAIWLAVRLLKDDTRFPTIPANYRWAGVFAIGQVSAVLEHWTQGGMTWTAAIIGGVISALGAIALNEGVVGTARDGKDIPLPAFVRKDAEKPTDARPPSLPAVPAPPALKLKDVPTPWDTPPPLETLDTPIVETRKLPPNNTD